MRKLTFKEWIAVALALAVVVTFFYFFVPFSFFQSTFSASTDDIDGTESVSEIVTDSGLIIRDLISGTGKEAVNGQVVVVHYVGRLEDGTLFDSSLSRGQPFAFLLGSGQVIQGWEQGFVGMKVGGRRVLTIPPSLGYGESGTASIPPNSTLVFEVTLLDVVSPSDF